MRTARHNLALDAALAIVTVAGVWTGLSVAHARAPSDSVEQWSHGLLGLAIGGLALAHLLRHRTWIAKTLAQLPSRLPSAGRGLLLVDALLVVAFGTVTVSGLAIWDSPLRGADSGGWVWAHHASGKLALLVGLYHVAQHARWIAGSIRSLAREARGRTSKATRAAGVSGNGAVGGRGARPC